MEPNYILRADEAVSKPVNKNKLLYIIKKLLWIIIGIILIGSFFFYELSMNSRLFLIVIGFLLLFVGNKAHRVPSPFELRFYDDFLIVYREKFYYNPKVSCMQFDKFFYKDIKTCEFRTNTQRINIYGIVEGIWYNYDKDGTVSSKPSYDKTTDSICYFYTSASNVDFVREIEEHSPIKVVVENN